MPTDSLILDVRAPSLHDGRHLGLGVRYLGWLLEREYAQTVDILDPLQWNDTARLRRHVVEWSGHWRNRSQGIDRVFFLSTICTHFIRHGKSFVGLAVSSSVQGRPRTMLRAEDLFEAMSPGASRGKSALVLNLKVAPSRRNTEVYDTQNAIELIVNLSQEWSVDVLLCAAGGGFDLGVSSEYRPQELSFLRALKAAADRASAVSMVDLRDEMTRSFDDLGRTTVIASVMDDRPTLLRPARTKPRFPDYIIDDLYSPGPGSRLDAIVELIDIAVGRSKEASPEEAKTALTELAKTDLDLSVRAEALKALEEQVRLTVQDLAILEICHEDVHRDMRRHPHPSFIKIPAGSHRIGVSAPIGQWFERPEFQVELPSFLIAKTPVTTAQYYQFVEDTGRPVPFDWTSDAYLLRTQDFPVVYVSYYDAVAYCEWLTKKLHFSLPVGAEVSLPTELEWEAAARWPYGHLHPWGDVFDRTQCNALSGGLARVVSCGRFSPDGNTAAGLLDMIGNVWEWTESLWGASGRAPATLYPLMVEHDRLSTTVPSNIRRIVRGAAYYYTDECSNSYTRNRAYPEDVHKAGGFRPVVRGVSTDFSPD